MINDQSNRPVLIEQGRNLIFSRLSSPQFAQTLAHDSKFEIMFFHGHQNSTDLNQARMLLHDYYVKRLEWMITEGNPSGLWINNQRIFSWIEDDYDLDSLWFVVRHSKQVVACARLCFPDAKGLLEIERYQNACRVLNPLFVRYKNNLIELNREAIAMTPINNTKCYLLLLQAIFKYCLERQQVLLTTTNIKDWVKCYKKIGFTHQVSYRFKYFDHEKSPVNVYIAETKDLNRMLGVIQCQLKQLA